ncbi:cytochrome P450 [Lenzites betulinus]|nr:cytochrome P450 [Lenzites betulinus]
MDGCPKEWNPHSSRLRVAMTLLQDILIGAAILYAGWRISRALFVTAVWDIIPGPPSRSYLAGNTEEIFGPEHWEHTVAFVEKYGPLFKVRGPLQAKWLYTYDPRAMHNIFLKDQDIFEGNSSVVATFQVTLGPGLLATLGHQHRRQRKMLNPLFSAKHLREMTPTFNDTVARLQIALASRLKEGALELDLLGWMGRTALELIGQGGLGHSFDPLTTDIADEFSESVKAFFPAMHQVEAFFPLIGPSVKIGTPWLRRKVVEMLPSKSVQRLVQITDSLHECSVRIYNEKKAALESGDEELKRQVSEDKDIMSVLLRANMTAAEDDRLKDDEVIGQISTLVLAAMDTTSNALSRIFHLLSEHPDVQQNLRDEITRARDDGTGKLRDLTYDEVMELPYLDAVCRETLRRHSPATRVLREATRDTMLPLSKPIRALDGTLLSAIPVTKGMWIIADVQASNCNKELWGDDADEWRPERWLSPLPSALEDARIPGVYSHLMTFAGGSRACIGFKFSQLEMKVVLASLLPTMKFEPSGKEIFWNAAGVAFPSVGKFRGKPEMPLKVTLL